MTEQSNLSSGPRRLTIGWAGVIVVAGLIGLILNLTAPTAGDQLRAEQVFYLLIPVVSGGIGGLIAVRVPRNPSGWLLLVAMTALTLTSLSKAALHQSVGGSHAFDSVLRWAAWFNNWTWTVAIACVLLLIALFPNGRVATPRWRWLPGAIVIVTAPLTVMCAIAPRAVDDPAVRPILQIVPDRYFDFLDQSVGQIIPVIGVTLLLTGASLIARRRRAMGVEREQLRWLLWSFGLFVVANVLGIAVDKIVTTWPDAFGTWGTAVDNVASVIDQLTFLALPIGIFVAITRTGLYEIDRIISRTLSYTLITLLLAVSYLAIVAGVSFLVPASLGSLPVVLATLAVAALFVPVQRRISRAVDRRFNRSRYDAQLLVTRFAEQLRVTGAEQVGSDELIRTVHRALQPAHASVWLVPTVGRTS